MHAPSGEPHGSVPDHGGRTVWIAIANRQPEVTAPGTSLHPPVWHVVRSNTTVRASRGGGADGVGLFTIADFPTPLGSLVGWLGPT